MAQGVEGQWFIDLKVGGETLNANPSTLPSFQIINNIHQHLPSIKFTYKDASGATMNLASIADGTPIEVVVGTSDSQYPTMKFINLGMPNVQAAANSAAVTIKGILNSPSYLRQVADQFYKGNSSDVLSQMVSAVGLTPDVDSTNDSMTWLPISKTIASMARHITKYGWASDASCMLACVTDQGVFRYKNLENIISGGPSKVFSSSGIDGQQILDWLVSSKSHFGNASGGYGSTSARSLMDGTVKELKDVSATMLSQVLPMAQTLIEAAGKFGVRVDRIPLDTGNTHDKWAEARHQNARIASMFAFDVGILVDKPSFVNLLDLVDFRPTDPSTGEPATNIAGQYIVTGVTKIIHGMSYYERLTLTSQGQNLPGMGL